MKKTLMEDMNQALKHPDNIIVLVFERSILLDKYVETISDKVPNTTSFVVMYAHGHIVP